MDQDKLRNAGQGGVLKILLLGCNGQVGWELQRSLVPLGPVTALSRQGKNDISGDLADPKALAAAVKYLRPDVIVNSAAYTAVDKAEEEPESARTINAESPALLARTAKDLNAWLVHYSTDYVFDGSGTVPWQESDTPSPLNVYGQTKLEGEEAIRQSGCQHFIFRTSWVYSARGHNFIRTMLRLAVERESLRVVDDQLGAPTGAELIADITAHAVQALYQDNNLSGTYHLIPKGHTSWWKYARLVIDQAASSGMNLKVSAQDVIPVSSEEFNTVAARPRNSRLDTMKLRSTFGVHLPDWEDGVVRAIQEMLNSRGKT